MASMPVAMAVVIVARMILVLIMIMAGMVMLVVIVAGMILIIIVILAGMAVRAVLVSTPIRHRARLPTEVIGDQSSNSVPQRSLGEGGPKSITAEALLAQPQPLSCRTRALMRRSGDRFDTSQGAARAGFHYGQGGRRMTVPVTAIRTVPLVALALGLLFLVAACGTEPAPPEPGPEMPVEDLLALTGENLVNMSTARFQMVDEKETGAKFFGATLKNVDGEVQYPDSARILVEVESPAMGFAEIEIVAVGDLAFMKLSAGARWNPLPLDQVPFNFVRLGITLSDLLPKVQNAAIAGQESLESGPTIRVEGNLVSEDLSTLITSADPGHPIDLILWIDEADQVLRQIRLSGQIFNDDAPGTSRLIVLSDHNIPMDIQLPDTSS